mmetsp:Transcript_15512/g.41943  ORF Transcript_15512/g.41943 Transcript_15512/m.41943 type:complete len:205 (+) Transcript_15512:535-1149(+)
MEEACEPKPRRPALAPPLTSAPPPPLTSAPPPLLHGRKEFADDAQPLLLLVARVRLGEEHLAFANVKREAVQLLVVLDDALGDRLLAAHAHARLGVLRRRVVHERLGRREELAVAPLPEVGEAGALLDERALDQRRLALVSHLVVVVGDTRRDAPNEAAHLLDALSEPRADVVRQVLDRAAHLLEAVAHGSQRRLLLWLVDVLL